MEYFEYMKRTANVMNMCFRHVYENGDCWNRPGQSPNMRDCLVTTVTRTVLYWIAQFLGAMFGFVLARTMFGWRENDTSAYMGGCGLQPVPTPPLASFKFIAPPWEQIHMTGLLVNYLEYCVGSQLEMPN